MRKKRTEKSCGIHSNLPMAVGYEMKARPVPLFTTSSTSTFSSCARLPAKRMESMSIRLQITIWGPYIRNVRTGKGAGVAQTQTYSKGGGVDLVL